MVAAPTVDLGAQGIKENFAAWPKSNAQILAEGTRVALPQDPITPHPLGQKMGNEVLTPGWKEVMAQNKSAVEFLRAAKPRLQAIANERTTNGR